IIFLSHAYKYYLPAMTGVAIAIQAAAYREIAKLTAAQQKPLDVFRTAARLPFVPAPAVAPVPAIRRPRKGFGLSQGVSAAQKRSSELPAPVSPLGRFP